MSYFPPLLVSFSNSVDEKRNASPAPNPAPKVMNPNRSIGLRNNTNDNKPHEALPTAVLNEKRSNAWFHWCVRRSSDGIGMYFLTAAIESSPLFGSAEDDILATDKEFFEGENDETNHEVTSDEISVDISKTIKRNGNIFSRPRKKKVRKIFSKSVSCLSVACCDVQCLRLLGLACYCWLDR